MNENIDEDVDTAPSIEEGPSDDYEVFERVELLSAGKYTAHAEDLDFMWRWKIYRESDLAQHGCSLTLESSREAVRHVLVYMQGIEKS